jgi:outer membrane protein assembly factor BamB
MSLDNHPHAYARLTIRRLRNCSVAAVLALFCLASSQADWPQFRGPWGNGYVSAPGDAKTIGLPQVWSETNQVKWKTEIPASGWSTPVILEGQAWLTTATPDGHDFFALCVDTASGKILFNEKLFHCDKPEPLGNEVNGYATPSAVVEPGRVYVHFGSYGTACLDTKTFKVLWQRQDLPCRHFRGPASSLILFEDFLILTMDGVDVQYLAALDKKTGQTVWKTNRSVAWNDEDATDQMTRDGDRRKAHSTPLIVEVGGKKQLLSLGAKAAYGYEPATGKEIWRAQFSAWSGAPVPVFYKGLAIVSTGYGTSELLAIRTDGQGDVTRTHIAWKFEQPEKSVPKTATPILVDDLLYLVSDDGMVTCLEAGTGKEVWRKRLIGNYSASPIYADGQLYFCNQQGKTFLLKPGRTCEILETNVLDTGLMASPAVSGKALFLRTKTHLYRIENSSPTE